MTEHNRYNDYEIDIVDLMKYFYHKKFMVLAGLIIGLLCGWGYSMYKGPVYTASLKVQLPGYCSERVVNSASSAASGSVLIDSVYQNSNVSAGQVTVTAKPERNSTILTIAFSGKNEQDVKTFISVYEKEILPQLNSFVKDNIIEYNTDLVIPNHTLGEDARISVNAKTETIDRSPAVLQKSTRILGLAGIVGLLFGGIIVFFQYMMELYKKDHNKKGK